jgi:hypothetical protein
MSNPNKPVKKIAKIRIPFFNKLEVAAENLGAYIKNESQYFKQENRELFDQLRKRRRQITYQCRQIREHEAFFDSLSKDTVWVIKTKKKAA